MRFFALFLVLLLVQIPKVGYAITYQLGSDNTYYTTGAVGFGFAQPYDTLMGVSGTFKISASDIAPNISGELVESVEFSFFDGLNAITDQSATAFSFLLWTNNSKDIIAWDIAIEQSMQGPGGSFNRIASRYRYYDPLDKWVNDFGANEYLCGGSSALDGCGLGGPIDPYGYRLSALGDGGQFVEKVPSVTPVPLPTSAFLLLGGLAFLGLVRRKA